MTGDLGKRPGCPRVAVIGSGVSGLTAAYLLRRRFDVTLFEAAGRLGGHADTHDVVTPDAGTLPVDTGFIVYNDATYPNLRRLLAELEVQTQPTTMSMSIHCEGCGLEYAGGRGVGGVLAQPRSAVTPAFMKMLVQVKKFHRQARAMLAAGDDQLTLREFLAAGGFSPYFVRHFVVPVVSSCGLPQRAWRWSTRPGICLCSSTTTACCRSPAPRRGGPSAAALVRTSSRSPRRCLRCRCGTTVRSVMRSAGRVEVRDDCDQVTSFDRVVMAMHADEALRLLHPCTDEERATLSAFSYSRNETWLHTDESVLPRAPRARSSWNYLLPGCDVDTDAVLVSYDMNRLQALPTHTPHLVTLNATGRIDPALVLDRMTYEHPIYSLASVKAQEKLPGLNDGTIAFAGAYHGWGFHEDGCRSGVAAAESLGVAW